VGHGQGVSVKTATANHSKAKAEEPTMQFLQQLTVIHPALLCRTSTTIKIENPPYMSLTVENNHLASVDPNLSLH
jgi:hypothetical protein